MEVVQIDAHIVIGKRRWRFGPGEECDARVVQIIALMIIGK